MDMACRASCKAPLQLSQALRWKHRMRSKELVEVAGPRQNTLSSQKGHEITCQALIPPGRLGPHAQGRAADVRHRALWGPWVLQLKARQHIAVLVLAAHEAPAADEVHIDEAWRV